MLEERKNLSESSDMQAKQHKFENDNRPASDPDQEYGFNDKFVALKHAKERL